MARRIIIPGTTRSPETQVGFVSNPVSTGLTGARLQMRLNARRTKAYVEALARLDAGGHALTPASIAELMSMLAAEFPEVSARDLPLGIAAICRLGSPYEVHTLDVCQSILTHYKLGQVLPSGMEKARNLAIHPSYAFVEIYLNHARAVRPDGTVSTISL